MLEFLKNTIISKENFGGSFIVKIPDSSKVLVLSPKQKQDTTFWSLSLVDVSTGRHQQIKNNIKPARAEGLAKKLIENLQEHGSHVMFKSGPTTFEELISLIKQNI